MCQISQKDALSIIRWLDDYRIMLAVDADAADDVAELDRVRDALANQAMVDRRSFGWLDDETAP